MLESEKILEDIRRRREAKAEAKLTPMDRALSEFKALLATEMQIFRQAVADAKVDIQQISNSNISSALASHLSSISTKVDEATAAQAKASESAVRTLAQEMAERMEAALTSNATRFEEAMRTERVIEIHRDSKNLMDYVTSKPRQLSPLPPSKPDNIH